MTRPSRRVVTLPLVGIAAITVLAGLLRLVALRHVPDNPFYDAAVRSMTHSWHNFVFGAFEPGGSAAIDKPPLDLWLQVIAVKLLGYSSFVLKLPSALASVLAVPLLYAVVRRVAGAGAGLASATALAILPVAVVTGRSDTMDSLMMLGLVVVAGLLVLAVERGGLGWLLLAAAVLGLDFNVKLFEGMIAAPAFVLFYVLASRGRPLPALAGRLAGAAGVFVAVALCWLLATSLVGRHDRPWSIGSTNGSAWNSVFVFNGTDRILKAPHPSPFDAVPQTAAVTPPAALRTLAHHHKHRRPSAPAGPLRLFKRSLVDFGGLIGTVLFAALVLGAAALAPFAARGRWRTLAPIELAAAAALAVWLLTGLLLFSFAGRVHPRYLEAFTPAVAAAVGVGAVALARRAGEGRWRAVMLAALALAIAEAASVTGHGTLVRSGLFVGVGIGLATALAAFVLPARRRNLLAIGVLASLLAFPLTRDMRLIRDHSGVQAASPRVAPRLVAGLSRFLRAHQTGGRYEFAAGAPSLAAPLVVRDQRPILLLTTVDARPLVTLAELRTHIAAGQVRYVITRGRCPQPPYRLLPACSESVRWVVAHGRDITAGLGVPGQTSGILYDVSRALTASA